ncbi:hypothetical protein [Aneurinibacillus aneurinilyticus]|nr:hypothetical protein [Aneurinibacillus aneurinilyticus]MED0705306.1 hypothetical protein [Aneurinibacillus aneurinilyticus]MED0726178.1 hypothetical protein [Aneurinibacillus aneurinilyticus]MED0733749.1 hypothetical protein [Aneurinibacillus aneurinilyticus]MED0741969.1 hypothetical protein [Aneurinibacillus aneurinilyticus]
MARNQSQNTNNLLAPHAKMAIDQMKFVVICKGICYTIFKT